MNGDTPRHPNPTAAPRDDYPREACGIVGIYSPGEDVARHAFFGLYALQHRGQESAGIASSTGDGINIKVSMGTRRAGIPGRGHRPASRTHRHRTHPLLHHRQQRHRQRTADMLRQLRPSTSPSPITAMSSTPAS